MTVGLLSKNKINSHSYIEIFFYLLLLVTRPSEQKTACAMSSNLSLVSCEKNIESEKTLVHLRFKRRSSHFISFREEL